MTTRAENHEKPTKPETQASQALPRSMFVAAADPDVLAAAREGNDAAVRKLGCALFGEWPLPNVSDSPIPEAADTSDAGDADGEVDDADSEAAYDGFAEEADYPAAHGLDDRDRLAGFDADDGAGVVLDAALHDSPVARFVKEILCDQFPPRVLDEALRRIASVFRPRIIGRYKPDRATFADWLALNAEDLTLQQLVLEHQRGRADAEVIATVYRLYFQRPDEVTGGHTNQPSLAEFWIRQVFRGGRGIEPNRGQLEEVRDLFVIERLATPRFWGKFNVALGASFRRWLVQAVHNLTRDFLAKAQGPRFVSIDDTLGRVLRAQDTDQSLDAHGAPAGGRDGLVSELAAHFAGESGDAPNNGVGDVWARVLPVIFADADYQLCYKLMSDLDLTPDEFGTLARERLVRWAAEIAVAIVGGYDPVDPPLPSTGAARPSEADGENDDDDAEEEPADTSPTTTAPAARRRSKPTVIEAPYLRLEDEEIRAIKAQVVQALAPALAAVKLPKPIPRDLSLDERNQLITIVHDEIEHPDATTAPRARKTAAAKGAKGSTKAGASPGFADLLDRVPELATIARRQLASLSRYGDAQSPLARALAARHDELRKEFRRRATAREQKAQADIARDDVALRQREHQARQIRLNPTAGPGEIARLDQLEAEVADLRRIIDGRYGELGRTVGFRDAEIGYMLGRTHGAIAGLKNRIRRNLDEFRRGVRLTTARSKVLARVPAGDGATLRALAEYDRRLLSIARFEANPLADGVARQLATACPTFDRVHDDYLAALTNRPESADRLAELRREVADRAALLRQGLPDRAVDEYESIAISTLTSLLLLGVGLEDVAELGSQAEPQS